MGVFLVAVTAIITMAVVAAISIIVMAKAK